MRTVFTGTQCEVEECLTVDEDEHSARTMHWPHGPKAVPVESCFGTRDSVVKVRINYQRTQSASTLMLSASARWLEPQLLSRVAD